MNNYFQVFNFFIPFYLVLFNVNDNYWSLLKITYNYLHMVEEIEKKFIILINEHSNYKLRH